MGNCEDKLDKLCEMSESLPVGKLSAISGLFPVRSSEVTKPNMISAPKGRDCSSFMVILLLALFHHSQAYVSVSMNGLCKQREFTLGLSPSRPTSLLLDTVGSPGSSCKLEIVAPETHSISLLYTRRKRFQDRKKSESVLFSGTQRTPQCILTVSFPLFRHDEEMKLRLDLCSEEALITSDIDVLPSRITLEWKPMVKSVDDILVSEIVVAALGRGRDFCSQPGQLYCNPKYPLYCISKELVCDGKRNCPEGSDEEKELCSSSGNREKTIIGRSNNDHSTHIGQDWEFVASEVLKKLTAKDSGHPRKTGDTLTTEKSMVLWSDDGNLESDESESLPDILKHYGPWGYLMLGMLICGTVLMFCGLWECCCRKPKSSSSSSTAGPTLLIINQGAQQNDMETPQTPGPPRYEDLDQPPSYAALFPSSKSSDFQPNILPIMIPMVDSLSNLLTNSSSSQNVNQPAENTEHSTTSSSGQTSEVYTIGLRRDSCESNPK